MRTMGTSAMRNTTVLAYVIAFVGFLTIVAGVEDFSF
jgi:hypothetical protein